MEKLDFNAEIKEFIDQGFIKDYQKIQDNQEAFIIKFKTLENYDFLVQCSVENAIEIKKSNQPDLDEKRFECWEQLLNLYSPLYIQKFSDMINEKLKNIE